MKWARLWARVVVCIYVGGSITIMMRYEYGLMHRLSTLAFTSLSFIRIPLSMATWATAKGAIQPVVQPLRPVSVLTDPWSS